MRPSLDDFGLLLVHRDAQRMYMRGIGDSPLLHITELGPPGVISFAYQLRESSLLSDVARMPGATGIENLDLPGGGRRVRLRDLNGFWLEFIGQQVSVRCQGVHAARTDGASRARVSPSASRIRVHDDEPRRGTALDQQTLASFPRDCHRRARNMMGPSIASTG